jgi:Predicted hydrocarbon binding protein (contains V4R domain)
MEKRKYKFDWGVITGNLENARPNIGLNTRIEVYRLFQFTLRDVLEQRYGADQTDELFREAGIIAGKEFFKNFCGNCSSLPELVNTLQASFKELGVGILRMEHADTEKMRFVLTVEEDLDCSGMPDTAEQICVYDEGFIKGILDSFTGSAFNVKEVDCWCTGARTCRFSADKMEG